MNNNDAITTIRLAHNSLGGAATMICDYIDDPAAISSPTLITAMETLIDLAGDDDITAIHELIQTTHPDLATQIALRAELCDACSSDAECCTCE